MYIGLYVKYRYYCQVLIKLGFSIQIFEKYTNSSAFGIKQTLCCHIYPPSLKFGVHEHSNSRDPTVMTLSTK
jgi:hypothetical protein